MDRRSGEGRSEDAALSPSGVLPSCPDDAPPSRPAPGRAESFISVQSMSRNSSSGQLMYPGDDFPAPKPRAVGRWDSTG